MVPLLPYNQNHSKFVLRGRSVYLCREWGLAHAEGFGPFWPNQRHVPLGGEKAERPGLHFLFQSVSIPDRSPRAVLVPFGASLEEPHQWKAAVFGESLIFRKRHKQRGVSAERGRCTEKKKHVAGQVSFSRQGSPERLVQFQQQTASWYWTGGLWGYHLLDYEICWKLRASPLSLQHLRWFCGKEQNQRITGSAAILPGSKSLAPVEVVWRYDACNVSACTPSI